ncbi:phosphatase PAP2 family protein [Bacteroidia bacterium]|nr:phosphatase PAP2 family protein [Bacteroidia bacterium]
MQFNMLNIIDLDKRITLAINGLHADRFDSFMVLMSDKWIWIPFYALLLYFVIRQYKRQSWIVVLGLIALIVIADQTSVHCFKNVVQRLRPCHDPTVAPFLHLVNGHCGGQYGFISSHAVNVFALTGFFNILYAKKLRILKITLIVWAIVVSYSRIYLGVHFFGDVLCGALWGLLLAILIGKTLRFLFPSPIKN